VLNRGLIFIELGSPRVHLVGCTPTPNGAWVTQQARQFTWAMAERTPPMRFLIHDRDSKFSRPFDTVFQGQGIEIIRTPVRAPTANAFAERWIRSVRAEGLDQLLMLDQRHLRRVLTEYMAYYYNRSRPHQRLA
jgi:transposase InsO family protein